MIGSCYTTARRLGLDFLSSTRPPGCACRASRTARRGVPCSAPSIAAITRVAIEWLSASRRSDGHPTELPFLRDPADRLPDGAVRTGWPRAIVRSRLSRRLGQALSRNLINPVKKRMRPKCAQDADHRMSTKLPTLPTSRRAKNCRLPVHCPWHIRSVHRGAGRSGDERDCPAARREGSSAPRHQSLKRVAPVWKPGDAVRWKGRQRHLSL